jgi:large subunit ribosomal protein L7/L12
MSRNWSPEVVEIGTRLAALKPDAALELLSYLKDNYGIEPPNIPGIKEEKLPEEKPPEKVEFDVVLEGYADDKRIGVIKAYREITAISLKEGMAAINGLPGTPIKVKEAVSKEEAEKLKTLLEAAGGKVSLK